MNDEFEALAPVEAPTNWIGGTADWQSFFAYWVVG